MSDFIEDFKNLQERRELLSTCKAEDPNFPELVSYLLMDSKLQRDQLMILTLEVISKLNGVQELITKLNIIVDSKR